MKKNTDHEVNENGCKALATAAAVVTVGSAVVAVPTTIVVGGLGLVTGLTIKKLWEWF